MRSTLASPIETTQRLLPETADRPVKANLRKAEMRDFRIAIGSAIDRARLLAGWSIKELAAAVSHDEAQVRRWISGVERPQFDALFAVEVLRQPLVIALAELVAGEGVTVTTQITVRRVA